MHVLESGMLDDYGRANGQADGRLLKSNLIWVWYRTWMNVVHAVLHDLPHLLQTLDRAHRSDRVALHEHIASREQLERLECGTVWS